MTKTKTAFTLLAGAAVVAGCAALQSGGRSDAEKATAMMKESFHPKGQATLARIDQDETQRLCSKYHAGLELPKDVAQHIEKVNLATYQAPTDGKYLGDWRRGEKIAQSGKGMQYSEDPKKAAGGNCYACHELAPHEVSYGTMGPSLRNFGRKHGFSAEATRYVYAKVYNSEAYAACSNMPRFGHNGVLTQQQIQDVTALLMDPNSPVNQ